MSLSSGMRRELEGAVCRNSPLQAGTFKRLTSQGIGPSSLSFSLSLSTFHVLEHTYQNECKLKIQMHTHTSAYTQHTHPETCSQAYTYPFICMHTDTHAHTNRPHTNMQPRWHTAWPTHAPYVTTGAHTSHACENHRTWRPPSPLRRASAAPGIGPGETAERSHLSG